MNAAVRRLVRAVRRNETVAIFGDYDVERSCQRRPAGGLPARPRPESTHPHFRTGSPRVTGPTWRRSPLWHAEGATLLVCVDCERADNGPLEEAEKSGLDVIVLDHHAASGGLPPARAVVNPNRLDDLSPASATCAQPGSSS